MSTKAEQLVSEFEAAVDAMATDEQKGYGERDPLTREREYNASRDSLLAYISLLEADRERLDWLEANGGETDRRVDGKGWRVLWAYDPEGGYAGCGSIKQTLREAIDAAATPKKKEEEED